MHKNAELVTRFYEAFNKKDSATMRASYTADATFSDGAFPGLKGDEVGDMWEMLTERAQDFRLEFRDVVADDTSGSAHWEAWYLFNGKHRVHNVIDAKFTFRDGRIATHVDTFNFWRWSRQALGLPGLLLGWTGFLQRTAQGRSKALLAAWREKRKSQT